VPDTAEASQLDAREEDVERTVSPELADELNYAPLANLKGYAVSEQATALVQHLAHKYPRVAQGSTKTKRTNKPRKLEPDFHRAIAAFLSELLAARAEEGAAGWLRLSLDKDKFKGALVSYRMFNGVRKTWRSAGLIEEQKGYPGLLGFGNPGPVRGRLSRFRATKSLLAICNRHSVAPARVTEDFHLEFEMPSEILRLTEPSRSTPDTPASRRLRDEVAELNAFFARYTLRGARHIGWVRMYHMAYELPYAWNKGGRLYSQPSMPALNYQQMPLERRLELRLDGKPVAEIDISASYLTLFYAWHGQKVDAATAYSNILGPDELDRAIVKTWVNSSFGNSGLLGQWSSDIKKGFAKRYRQHKWTIDPRKYPVRLVKEKTLARHPVLETWGHRMPGKPHDYGDLMCRESEIIVSTMLRLAREHGIPSMPVHDSLIVPLSEVETSKRVLDEQFVKLTGVRPTLKVRRSTLYDF
jgi:hypothetical protein